MSTVRITTAWAKDPHRPDDAPWLVSAYDEFTEDTWNGTPDFFPSEVRKVEADGYPVRIVNVVCDLDVIEGLFEVPDTKGTLEPVDG